MTFPGDWKKLYPEKFADEAFLFSRIRRCSLCRPRRLPEARHRSGTAFLLTNLANKKAFGLAMPKSLWETGRYFTSSRKTVSR
jgi:hypothetical protein